MTSIIATSSFTRKLAGPLDFSASGRSRKIDMQRGSVLQLDCALQRRRAVHPRLQRVTAGGQSTEAVAAGRVALREMRRRQNEDEPAHVLVNLAMQRDEAGRVEGL